ncbi:MAG: cation-transporting P-type ATPase, partial [Clostridia bacterium]|nr:cation-transporting P-type ATPase [Clostridia bacterium]
SSHGHNHYREKKSEPILKHLRDRMNSLPMILIMLAGLFMFGYHLLRIYNGLSASLIEPLIILLVPPLGHIACAIWQRYGTAKLDALSNIQTNTVNVLRDGESVNISAADVVRGDILLLEQGMIIPADCRLIEATDLFCDEYIITGDDMDVAKNADCTFDGVTAIKERVNMLYAGCGVSKGTGKAVVVSTGQSTEYALMLNDPRNQASPLPGINKDIASLERLISLPVLVIAALALIISLLRIGFSEGLTVISPMLVLAGASIPSGLTVAAVIAMAMGMQHVVSRNADVQDLSVMDTLSRVTVICADKTGTLTSDEKRPVCVYTGEIEQLSRIPSNRAQTLIRLATLCTANDTQKTGIDNRLLSNPTESAIIEYARDIGIERRVLMEETPRLAELPFDTNRRCMSVVHLVAGRRLMITMGAPETVLSYCTAGPTENADEANREMAAKALRVLAVAYKYVDDIAGTDFDDSQENCMTFAGLIALADQAREDCIQAIKECADGGIITVMITGDNETTACAVAKQLGIMQDDTQLLTGEQLQAMSHEELDASVGIYRVFARIAPEDKERIIRAWQKRDAIVVATGNSLADVPALQRANIGCATGAADCDMTRNESDLTLYDNSFSTLVDCIKQARGIYANIRKVWQYALTCSVSLLSAMLMTLVVYGEFVLSPMAMVVYWLVGMLCSLSISYESGDKHSLGDRPRRGLSRLMPASAWIDTIWQGLLAGVCVFVAFNTGRFGASIGTEPAECGMTTAFLTLMFSRLWLILATHRHDPDSPHFANRVMPVVLFLGAVITVVPVLLPSIGVHFGLVTVEPSNWILAFVFSVIPAIAAIIARIVVHMLTTVRHVEHN